MKPIKIVSRSNKRPPTHFYLASFEIFRRKKTRKTFDLVHEDHGTEYAYMHNTHTLVFEQTYMRVMDTQILAHGDTLIIVLYVVSDNDGYEEK